MCDKKSIYFISFVGKVDFFAYRNFQACGRAATVALDTNFGMLGDTFESPSTTSNSVFYLLYYIKFILSSYYIASFHYLYDDRLRKILKQYEYYI